MEALHTCTALGRKLAASIGVWHASGSLVE